MTREEFLAFQKETFNKLISITEKKNADYAGKGGNAFNNFTRVEMLGIATTEQGFVTRMTDKLSRIISFMQNGELLVKDESVEDTLLDLANYCVLMAGYLKSKKVDTSITVDQNVNLSTTITNANATATSTPATAPHRRMGIPEVARALAASQDTKTNTANSL
jgi:hypothetical protein